MRWRFGGRFFNGSGLTECLVKCAEIRARHGEHDGFDGARVCSNPLLEQLNDLRFRETLAPARVCVHNKRLDSVHGGDVQQAFDARREAIEAFALGAVIFKRTLTIGFRHGDNVGGANLAVADEGDARQIHGAAREQHAAHVAAVFVVVGTLHAAKYGVEVALGAQDLLGSERAVFVGAAGARVGNGVDNGRLALSAAQRGDGEICGDAGLGRIGDGLGQLECCGFAVLVNHGRIDSGLGFFGECALHKGEMLGGFGAPFIASGHGFLPWSELLLS